MVGILSFGVLLYGGLGLLYFNDIPYTLSIGRGSILFCKTRSLFIGIPAVFYFINEYLLFYLKRKTANLEKIMEYSAEYQDIIEGFLVLLPEGVEVKNFSISEDKEIGFGGNTNSFGAMTQLFDNIEQGRLGESIIYAAEVKKVGYNEGIYSFSFQLNLNPVDLTDKEK